MKVGAGQSSNKRQKTTISIEVVLKIGGKTRVSVTREGSDSKDI